MLVSLCMICILGVCAVPRELGKQAREEAEKQRQLLEEGRKVYLDYTARGKEAIKEKEVCLQLVCHLMSAVHQYLQLMCAVTAL